MSYNGARPKENKTTRYTTDRAVEITERSTAEDSCEFYRQLSVRLFDVLDGVGASNEFRKLRQKYASSREIIMTICQQNKQAQLTTYVFGSSSEGTTTPGLNSDLDIFQCIEMPIILGNVRESEDVMSFKMVRDHHTQPGYVKLQYILYGQSNAVFTFPYTSPYMNYDSEGKLCLKHLSLLGKYNHLVDTRNGPADTSTEQRVDCVFGFRCSTIPEFAKEWISRDRQYKWPSTRMLDKMATMGCFVVGVGHPASMERNLEWRMSFSLQERELMFSMNIVQHKCYILLKIIKNDLIKPKVGKSISSYHLKTCMFYVIENTHLSFWKRENLTLCVMVCLYVLLKWIYTGYCPNYFIKEENMFDRDMHRSHRLNLLKLIQSLLSQGCCFLFVIQLDQIGVILKNYTKSTQMLSKQIQSTVNIIFENIIISVNMFRNELCCDCNKHQNATQFMSKFLQLLSRNKPIMDYNGHETKVACTYIIPFIHLQLAQSYSSLSFNTSTTDAKYVLLQMSNYHLRKMRHSDLTSSILLKATVFFKMEQYDRCIGTLDQLECVSKRMQLSYCNCFTRNNYLYCEHYELLYTLPVSQILKKTSTCMRFLRSDISITPEALQYEMFRSLNTPHNSRCESTDQWFDLAVVDAVVYIPFLQYLAHAKLNQLVQKHASINKLESVLRHEINIGHRETGYNLLGWIHFQENCIPRGIKYFQTSWSIRPHHNAAKLHLLKLIKYRRYQS